LKTPFCEAIEMKQALMAEYGIPADAILIDPHARHTTTNIRNAARLLYCYGFPFEKTALITTDQGQSASIEAPTFAQCCINERGYLPDEISNFYMQTHSNRSTPNVSLEVDAVCMVRDSQPRAGGGVPG